MSWWYQHIIKAQVLPCVCFTMKKQDSGEIGILGYWLYFSNVLAFYRSMHDVRDFWAYNCGQMYHLSYLICITTFVLCLEPHIFVCCMHIICFGIICILFVGRLTFAQPRICQSLEQARAGRGISRKNMDDYLKIFKYLEISKI